MEPTIALLAGLYFAAAVYLLLSRHVIRMVLGVALLGNAVNLLLLTAGRLTLFQPPVMGEGDMVLAPGAANPLPQALILTAIVISFAFFAFLLVLAYRSFQDLDTDDTDQMTASEPADQPMPPTGY